jgi:hypothetical protein
MYKYIKEKRHNRKFLSKIMYKNLLRCYLAVKDAYIETVLGSSPMHPYTEKKTRMI